MSEFRRKTWSETGSSKSCEINVPKCNFFHFLEGSLKRWFRSEKSRGQYRHVVSCSLPLIFSQYVRSPNPKPSKSFPCLGSSRVFPLQTAFRESRQACRCSWDQTDDTVGSNRFGHISQDTRAEEAVNASMDRGCLFLPFIKFFLPTFIAHQRGYTHITSVKFMKMNLVVFFFFFLHNQFMD